MQTLCLCRDVVFKKRPLTYELLISEDPWFHQTKGASAAPPAEQPAAASAPTLVVSPMPIKKFTPSRGRLLQGFNFPKSEQYRLLQAQGVSIADWLAIESGIRLDPANWGEYVVVKPDSAAKGAQIKIKRSGRVRHKPDGPDMLAQRFIYTGQWPNNYRVVTLFGKALMSWHCEADHGFPFMLN